MSTSRSPHAEQANRPRHSGTEVLMSTGPIAPLRLVAPSTGAAQPPFKLDRLAFFGMLASLADRPTFTYERLAALRRVAAGWGFTGYRRLRSGRGRHAGACRVARSGQERAAASSLSNHSPLYATSPSRRLHLRIRFVERIPD
jgi:hypothetical protein